MYIFLILISIALASLTAFMYIRTSKILDKIDKMIDAAIDGTFSESGYTEAKLSRLEAKMYRYLSAGKTARNHVISERNAVEALVNDISHQTRTPISNILLYTQLLSESENLDGNSRKLLSHIEGQTNKLSFLISSLVKTSRLESGTVSVTPRKNSTAKLLAGIDYTSAAREKDISLTIETVPDLTAVFDLKWTGEALSNIIDNAIKYTPCGGSVTVSAKDYEMFVRIDVEDTGMGISEEDTSKIFTRFYRSPSASDEYGVGIGLYLAREILTEERGYIKVSSQIGKGSVFSMFLPKR